MSYVSTNSGGPAMSDHHRIYLPYIVGVESPIPYLFEKTIPFFSDEYDILVHSTDGSQYDSNSIQEIKTSNSNKVEKVLKLGLASIKLKDIIHTGAGGRIHYHASQLSRLRSSDVAQVHTFRVDIDPDRWDPKIRRATAGQADVVTAVSEHTAETAERKFGISPKVIYNGVDTTVFSPEHDPSPLFAEYGIENPIVMFVGSFERRKRPLDFVEVASRTPQASFVMAGDGPLFKKTESRAKSIDNLYLLGRVEKSKLPAMYADAKLLLFPTIKEGCPNVVLEAFSSGTPVVGYRATSMPELVNDKTGGILVEQDDTAALAAAVAEILECPDEEIGRNAREYAVQNHRFKQIASQYLEIYDSLLDN